MNGYCLGRPLTTAPPDQDAIDTARRANDLTKNVDWHLLHTLACLYAETGKRARPASCFLKVMELANIGGAGLEVWFGFGKNRRTNTVKHCRECHVWPRGQAKMEYPGNVLFHGPTTPVGFKKCHLCCGKNAGK